MSERDDYERIVSVRQAGIYESNYLKGNSPDGNRAFWLKHNLLRPVDGPAKAELWAVLFERDAAPIVAKREVGWSALELDPDAIGLRAGDVHLDRRSAEGAIADLSWSLALSGGQAPLFHFRHPAMYTAAFPKKKVLTPAPNLHFDGRITVGDTTWEVSDWVGLRGHNWGTEHAHTYAYASVNQWGDGDPTRTVDGFSSRVKLGDRLSPWLSAVVCRNPFARNNGIRHLLTRTEVRPWQWSIGWSRLHRGSLQLELAAPAERFVGLRYAHPDGSESCCYNTKFAVGVLQAGGAEHTTRTGELELLFPEPQPGVPLHPSPGWTQRDGDYRG